MKLLLPLITASLILLSILGTLVVCNVLGIFAQSQPPSTAREIPGSLFDKSLGTPIVADPKLKVEVVAENLDFPTTMAFLGPDDIIVLEKEKGTVTRITKGEILSEPLLKVKTASQVERGLLGVAVSKNESTKTNVFLYYSEIDNSTNGGNSVVSNKLYKYNLANNSLVSPKLLLELPATPGPRHNGGAIEMDSAGNLYVPIGDVDGHTTQTQNIDIGGPPDGTGGILRISQDGQPIQSIIGDTGPARKYYGYGIRNSYGLDFDPLSGKLWDTENGAGSADEINLVEPGFNSGWSKIQGKAPVDFDFSQLVYFDGRGKYRDPEFTWIDTVGPTKLKFLNTDKLGKEYENDLFVSDVHHGRIYDFKLNSTRTGLVLSGVVADKVADTDAETRELIFASDFGGISDMELGPDGYLYILSFARGIIYRILPAAG
jgi:aldose sugar dehydrogenase